MHDLQERIPTTDSTILAIGMLCFDEPRHAPRALRAILEQTHSNLVVRIFDNSTSAATFRALQPVIARDPRVSYVHNGSDLGAYRNAVQAFAWAASIGEFCAIASDHDVLRPQWAARLIAELRDDPDCVLAYSDVERIDEGGRSRPGNDAPSIASTSPLQRARSVLESKGMGNAFYGIYRSTVLEAVRLRRAITPDLLFILELAAHGTLRSVGERLYVRVDQRERLESSHLIDRQYERLGLNRFTFVPYWLRNASLILSGGFPPRRVTSPEFAIAATLLYLRRSVRHATKGRRRAIRRRLKRVRHLIERAAPWARSHLKGRTE